MSGRASGPDVPAIALIGVGGTISTLVDDPLDVIDYLETGRKVEPDEILGMLGDITAHARVEVVPYRSVSSSAIGPSDWIALARRIEAIRAERPDIAGIVLVHGTGSLEETAYFLHLVLADGCPVVLVGAQRPFNATSSDAAGNLLDAIRVAAFPGSAHRGVLVAVHGQIHCAREVTKITTYRLAAFASPETGPMGTVDRDRITFFCSPIQAFGSASGLSLRELDTLPRVDIAYAYAGADGTVVDALVAAGARGIVSAGFAPGMQTPDERAALERASAQGVVVVQASRAGSGRVAQRQALKQKGWIGAGSLNPQKARILLMLALTVSDQPEHVQDVFDWC